MSAARPMGREGLPWAELRLPFSVARARPERKWKGHTSRPLLARRSAGFDPRGSASVHAVVTCRDTVAHIVVPDLDIWRAAAVLVKHDGAGRCTVASLIKRYPGQPADSAKGGEAWTST
jgi:hypothetical protein